MTIRDRNKVVLYSPHFVAPSERGQAGYRATPPLSHLALAGALRDAGYEPIILDVKWDDDWRERVRNEIDSIAAFGVTALTGPAVSDGLEASAYAKSLRPDLPVIWGGWHATYAADQAALDPRIDVVVRGMGERTLVEVLDALRGGGSLRDIAGIHFREDGTVVQTPDRLPEDINHFPPPAYDLIRPERYIASMGSTRLAATIFSRGCPFFCDFCLDSRQKWFGLTLDRMLDDIRFWIAQGANAIRFYDGNFFLGRPRILEFCEALLAEGLERQFRWMATGVGNRIAQMDDGLLALLKRAGLSQVALGAESGSAELLGRITNKTTVEHTVEAVRRLRAHGINSYLFFMVGYPDEPPDALDATMSLIATIRRINPEAEMFLNFTTPLPGSEVFHVAVARGYVEAPRTFEDWARFDYLRPNLIPIGEDYARRVRLFSRYLASASPRSGQSALGALVRLPIRAAARWRVQHGNTRFPIDLALADAIRGATSALRPPL